MINFIRRERLYLLLIFFVLVVNLLYSGQPSEKDIYKNKKTFSNMTFNEIGVTEEKVKDFFESDKPGAVFFKYFTLFGIFIFFSAIIFNLYFIIKKRGSVTGDITGTGSVSWGFLDVIRATIVIVFISYLLGIGEAIFFKRFNINMDINLRMMFNTFLVDIAVVGTVFYFVIIKYRESLKTIGLKFSKFFKNVLTGITIYIFALPSLLVILLLSIWVLNLIGYEPPPQPVFEVLMEEKRSNVLIFMTIFVSIFGPIVEEMFFRGFMYGAAKKRIGVLGAAVFTGVVFSVLHTNVVGFFPILGLGVLLAYLYEKTGSLVSSIAVHIAHNSAILVFVFFIKEMIK